MISNSSKFQETFSMDEYSAKFWHNTWAKGIIGMPERRNSHSLTSAAKHPKGKFTDFHDASCFVSQSSANCRRLAWSEVAHSPPVQYFVWMFILPREACDVIHSVNCDIILCRKSSRPPNSPQCSLAAITTASLIAVATFNVWRSRYIIRCILHFTEIWQQSEWSVCERKGETADTM